MYSYLKRKFIASCRYYPKQEFKKKRKKKKGKKQFKKDDWQHE